MNRFIYMLARKPRIMELTRLSREMNCGVVEDYFCHRNGRFYKKTTNGKRCIWFVLCRPLHDRKGLNA